MHQFNPIIQEGDTVIISGGSVLKTNVVKKRQMVRIGNSGNFDTGSLIGHRFGDVFEYDHKKKALVPSAEHPDNDRTAMTNTEVDGETKDNRDLHDVNVAQTVTLQEVEALKKEEGVKGIVDALVKNSATFESKTAFSQEKYVRRKKNKYAVLFKVDRVTTDNLAEVHCPSKIELLNPIFDSRHLRLRVDSVAQILSYGNIHSNVRCMLHDTSNGVLAGAILERMSNEGRIYNVLDAHCHPALHVARQMRLPLVKERWTCVPYSTYFVTDEPLPERDEEEEKKRLEEKAAAILAHNKERGKDENAPPPTDRVSQWVRAKEARELLQTSPVDSLIVAEAAPKEVVLNLIQFVAFGGSISIYCPYLEPLCQLFTELREEVVCMRLMDTWMREYQVLPGRTHPTVNMNASGGYMLSGIRVEKSKTGESLLEEPEDVTEQPQKRKRY